MEAITLISPAKLLIVTPFFLVLLWEAGKKKRNTTVAMADLEFLRSNNCLEGRARKIFSIFTMGLMVLLLGILWSDPTLYSTQPLFVKGEQLPQKNIMIAIDMSRSMGQPLKIPDREARLAMIVSGPESQSAGQPELMPTRYELARETLVNFMHRFEGSRFGLILFSTEPFLARWPTNETSSHFMEIMEERIGPHERSQLQRFSALTNIDEALGLARNVFARQEITGQAVVLISDAEDEMEAMSMAIRNLRADGIRLYIIGVGISELIVEKLSREFAGDAGFRIFRVDSDEEMEVAYNLVSELEESPVYADEDDLFAEDIRWIFALILFVTSAVIICAMETIFHQSRITNQ
jgi:hypothetical protein